MLKLRDNLIVSFSLCFCYRNPIHSLSYLKLNSLISLCLCAKLISTTSCHCSESTTFQFCNIKTTRFIFELLIYHIFSHRICNIQSRLIINFFFFYYRLPIDNLADLVEGLFLNLFYCYKFVVRSKHSIPFIVYLVKSFSIFRTINY